MSAEFISGYLAKLGQQGIQGQENICAAIRQEIADIDQRAEEVEREKEHRRKLLMVLEHMGDTSYRRQRLTGNGEVAAGADLEDNSPEAKAVRQRIVDLFGEHDALTNVEIRTKTGCGNDRLVIRAIKWLGERLILDRDRSTSELKIIRGQEFDRAKELLEAS